MPPFYNHPFVEGLSLIPRDTSANDNPLKSVNPSPDTTLKIVASVWVVGWLVFGLISVISLNSRGQAGYWIPDWYLDTDGKKRAKLSVTTWWACVLLFWPIIWIIYLVGITWRAIKRGWNKQKEEPVKTSVEDSSEEV